jgi:hypothetical protein
MDMSMDTLGAALLDLSGELPEFPTPMLIGGGFGLYLKQRHMEEEPPPIETLFPGELWPPARATQDVDLLLPTEVIVSLEYMRSIRAALDRLGYKPDVEFFQFSKQTSRGSVKIDLLTCDVPAEHVEKVKLNPPRVRPGGNVQLHAYLTKEALALSLSPFELTLRGQRSDGGLAELVIHIPNPFTYMLMKLHALRDLIKDKRKNLGAHHALDIYRIVSMLTREEYYLVRKLSTDYADSEAVVAASTIVRNSFKNLEGIGLLRLRKGAMEAGLQWSEVRSDDFVSVLGELFP